MKGIFLKQKGCFFFELGAGGYGGGPCGKQVRGELYCKHKVQLHAGSAAGWMPGDVPGERCCQATDSRKADLALSVRPTAALEGSETIVATLEPPGF